jgi:hypothetical protein
MWRTAAHAHPGARNLIMWVRHVDPRRYLVCQNSMRVIAVIGDPQVMEKILRIRLGHCHLRAAVRGHNRQKAGKHTY